MKRTMKRTTSARWDHFNHGMTEILDRQWAPTLRREAIATNARALAYLFANAGTRSEHGEARSAGFTDDDYAAVDRLSVDLADIQAKFDRERARPGYEGPQEDEHGPTVRFICAWLHSVCDSEGHLDTPCCEAAILAAVKQERCQTLRELKKRTNARRFAPRVFDRSLKHLESAGFLRLGGASRGGSRAVVYLKAD